MVVCLAMVPLETVVIWDMLASTVDMGDSMASVRLILMLILMLILLDRSLMAFPKQMLMPLVTLTMSESSLELTMVMDVFLVMVPLETVVIWDTLDMEDSMASVILMLMLMLTLLARLLMAFPKQMLMPLVTLTMLE